MLFSKDFGLSGVFVFSYWGYSVLSLNSATWGELDYLGFFTVWKVLAIADKVLSWIVLSEQSCLSAPSGFECVSCSLRILMHGRGWSVLGCLRLLSPSCAGRWAALEAAPGWPQFTSYFYYFAFFLFLFSPWNATLSETFIGEDGWVCQGSSLNCYCNTVILAARQEFSVWSSLPKLIRNFFYFLFLAHCRHLTMFTSQSSWNWPFQFKISKFTDFFFLILQILIKQKCFLW